VCGECQCDDPAVWAGADCSCQLNLTCPRNADTGEECSGAGHGVCECGQCQCEIMWQVGRVVVWGCPCVCVWGCGREVL